MRHLKTSSLAARAALLSVVFLSGVALTPAPALALNSERHYEMVSPVFKDGFGAGPVEAVAPDGESVAFYSGGAFAGMPTGLSESTTALFIDYLARRGASGWSTSPLPPPASLSASTHQVDVSPSLGTEFAIGSPGPESQNPLPGNDLFVHPTGLPDTPAGWELAGVLAEETDVTVNEVAASGDFCHVLLTSGNAALLKNPELQGTVNQVYEFDRGCDGERSSLALVGVNNTGHLIDRGCNMVIGLESYGRNGPDTFNAVSSDGGEVFFTDCLSGSTSPSSPHQLFVRLGGSRTIEVSRPLAPACESGGVAGEVPCAGALERGSADFGGASEDGSRVFFIAPLNAGQAPLVPGAVDASDNLYLATIGCPASKPSCAVAEREVSALAEVSPDPNGGAADVRGVVRVAPDGQRAYFIAGGDLLSAAQQAALEGEGRPVPRVGANNLYVYDASGAGTVAFIADLCSGAELSGSVEDIRCPSNLTEPEPGNVFGTNDKRLWSGYDINGSEAQTAGPDGRFLVFSSYARLRADDTNPARDVYRYDAGTGLLERVSTGENGFDANGNGELGSSMLLGHRGGGTNPVRNQHEMNSRAVSEDGSRIVFISAEPLSPAVTNGLANAYEWHEGAGGVGGAVSLVSTGSSEDPVTDVVISPSGADVFFVTSQGLVPQDTDGATDVYNARLGGGFAPAPAERRPCEGDACQGPLTNPAPLLVPGSLAQAPGENLAAPATSPPGQVKHTQTTKHKQTVRCRRGYRRDRHGRCVRARRARHA